MADGSPQDGEESTKHTKEHKRREGVHKTHQRAQMGTKGGRESTKHTKGHKWAQRAGGSPQNTQKGTKDGGNLELVGGELGRQCCSARRRGCRWGLRR